MPARQPSLQADFLKALAHPVRLGVLQILRQGPQPVSQLQKLTGVEPSSLSQQLAILRNRQIVVGEKSGANVIYRVVDPAIFDLLDALTSVLDHHLKTWQGLLADQALELREQEGDMR